MWNSSWVSPRYQRRFAANSSEISRLCRELTPPLAFITFYLYGFARSIGRIWKFIWLLMVIKVACPIISGYFRAGNIMVNFKTIQQLFLIKFIDLISSYPLAIHQVVASWDYSNGLDTVISWKKYPDRIFLGAITESSKIGSLFQSHQLRLHNDEARVP